MRLAVLRSFITIITAVIISITQPVLTDTLTTVAWRTWNPTRSTCLRTYNVRKGTLTI